MADEMRRAAEIDPLRSFRGGACIPHRFGGAVDRKTAGVVERTIPQNR